MVQAHVDPNRSADEFSQARLTLPTGLPGGRVTAEWLALIIGVAGQRLTLYVRELDGHHTIWRLHIE